MIIIPISHDEATVQRLPWVTFSIMGLCLVAFLATSQGQVEDPDHYLIEPMQYYLDRPYLELAPDMKARLEETGGSFLRQYLELFGAEQTPENTPTDPEILAQEQERLDGLTEQWIDARERASRSAMYRGGLVPARFSGVALITHMFLHAGWLHLIGNLFMFFLCGAFVEDKYGRPLFAALYLISGIAAGAGFAAMNPNLAIPLVGASGAIAGVMGAFLIRFWKAQIKFFYTIGLRAGTFDAPSWLMLPIWLGAQLWMALLMDYADPGGSQGGVAYWAHIWGFATGFSIAAAVKFWKIEERFIQPTIEAKLEVAENPVVDQATKAMESGKVEEALEMLRLEVRKHPESAPATLAYWDVAERAGHLEEAAPAMLRLIRQKLIQGDRELAVEYWNELGHKAPDFERTIPESVRNRILAALHPAAAPALMAIDAPAAEPGLETITPIGTLDSATGPGGAPPPPKGPMVIETGSGPLKPSAPVTATPVPPRQAAGNAALVIEPASGPITQTAAAPAPAAQATAGQPGGASLQTAVSSAAGAELVIETASGPLRPESEAQVHAEASSAGTQAAGPAMAGGQPMKGPAAASNQSVLAGSPAQLRAPTTPPAAPAQRRPAGHHGIVPPPLLDWLPPSAEESAAAPPPAPKPRRTLKVMNAVPVALEEAQISMLVEGRGQVALRYDRIRSVAAACIQAANATPWVLLDLALGDLSDPTPGPAPGAPASPELPVVRVVSTRFDPRKLIPSATNGREAFVALVDRLLGASGARPLPDRDAVRGRPFRTYTSVEDYERDVLQ